MAKLRGEGRTRPTIDAELVDRLDRLRDLLGQGTITDTVNWLLRLSLDQALKDAEQLTEKIQKSIH